MLRFKPVTLKWLMLFTIVIAFSCNLYDFSNTINSPNEYLIRGQQKYWNGDYLGAASDFQTAKEMDPSSCDAYWWHAKALIRSTNHAPLLLATDLSEIDPESDSLPFMDWTLDDLNNMYQVSFGIEADLAMLYSGDLQCDEFDSSGVGLDYAVSLAILGILSLRDTNGDNLINSNDIDFASNSYFRGDSLFIPEDQWNQLTNAQKNRLINVAESLLDRFNSVFLVIVDDIEGIDIQRINNTIGIIRAELEQMRP